MCQWGTNERIELSIPADLSHTGRPIVRTVGVDSCIASIVKALSKAGIRTRGSCCGHGKGDGSIVLQDGRELVIKNIEEDF